MVASRALNAAARLRGLYRYENSQIFIDGDRSDGVLDEDVLEKATFAPFYLQILHCSVSDMQRQVEHTLFTAAVAFGWAFASMLVRDSNLVNKLGARWGKYCLFFRRSFVMSNSVIKIVSAIAVVSALVGCASGVTRQTGNTAPPQVTTERIGKVVVSLSPEAQKKLVDNPGFSTEQLASVIKSRIGDRNMIDGASAAALDVEVTDLRVRSTAAAVLFGFMAGSDNLSGNVRLHGPNGDSTPFSVNASYALGGLAGGQDGTRMGWLYAEFAKLVATELYGEEK